MMEVLVVVATAVLASVALGAAVAAKFVAEEVMRYHYMQVCVPFHSFFCKHFLSPLLT